MLVCFVAFERKGDFMKDLSVGAKKFMLLPCDKMIFDKIFDLKVAGMECVCKVYDVSMDELRSLVWEEFDIPGMEVRVANTALNFLIDCCESEYDLCKTLKGGVKKVILAAAIFYTNVAPDAITDQDWQPPDQEKK